MTDNTNTNLSKAVTAAVSNEGATSFRQPAIDALARRFADQARDYLASLVVAERVRQATARRYSPWQPLRRSK